ncbi:MAG: hypothetical protein DRP78_01830 [Candidatus Omnitrophota bacterium]|nr:MAG: hypothetical protein DRP78_01830 [Candidatus Omnitrophota bacterium]
MAIDHSITYKNNFFKNYPHRQRLRKIFYYLDKIKNKTTYADIGCSNAYLTNRIAKKYNIDLVTGYDFCQENLAIARNNYANLEFFYFDLNHKFFQQQSVDDESKTIQNNYQQYSLVTCFETLEHVGNVEIALQNILKMVEKGGYALITVPIEVGFWGVLKFVIKVLFYNYNMAELNYTKGKLRSLHLHYLASLIFNKNITKYRMAENGYGTHFGFDFREIDKLLLKLGRKYNRYKHLTTVFYLIAG